MVDEGLAVALEAVDHLVAVAFGVVGRVGLVPGEQGGQQAHIGRRAGRLDDQAAVVGEFEVGFGLVGVGVAAALVADRHVHHGARHVALAPIPGLERADVAVRALHPALIAGIAAAAAAVVGP